MFRVRPWARPPDGFGAFPPPSRSAVTPSAGGTVTATDRPGDTDGALLTTRSLVILSLSLGVGVLSGLSAGLGAGFQAKAAGPAWAITFGLLAGLAAAVIAGVTVAASLNALVSRSD
jgi:hypothetical protein